MAWEETKEFGIETLLQNLTHLSIEVINNFFSSAKAA